MELFVCCLLDGCACDLVGEGGKGNRMGLVGIGCHRRELRDESGEGD